MYSRVRQLCCVEKSLTASLPYSSPHISASFSSTFLSAELQASKAGPDLCTRWPQPQSRKNMLLRTQTPSDCHTSGLGTHPGPSGHTAACLEGNICEPRLLIKWTLQGQAPICVRRWWLGPTGHDTALHLKRNGDEGLSDDSPGARLVAPTGVFFHVVDGKTFGAEPEDIHRCLLWVKTHLNVLNEACP